MWRRFLNTVTRFMAGRYGTDQLNRVLLWTYLALWLVSRVLRRFLAGQILALAALAVLAVWLWRTLSRNIPRRAAENDGFLRWWHPTKAWFSHQWVRLRDVRRYRYRRCPGCGGWLRLPIKRGRRTVTCHRCRAQFRAFFL